MKTVKLYTLCSQIVDCPHQTPIWLNEGIFVVRNYNLINGRIDKKNASYVDEDTYNKRIKRATPESGDIIISREAPMGVVGIVPEGMKCCLGQRLVLLKVNKDECDAGYLLYILQSYYVQSQIKQIDKTGSIVSNLNIPDLKNLDIPYVDISIQKKINKILSTLDTKIDINNKINKELEAMAKEIYNYWFVQNADKNWEKKKVGEIAEVIRGTMITEKQTKKGNIKVVAGGLDFNYYHSEFNREKNTITISGSGANAGYINIWYERIFASDCTTVRGERDIDTILIYHHLKNNQENIFRLAKGSAQPHVYPSDIKNIWFFEIPQNIKEKLSPIFMKINEQIAKNLLENGTLTQLRDFLLPLLMNGQIKVNTRK